MCNVVGGCNIVAILSMADNIVCLVCRNCGVHELGLYGMSGSVMLSNFIAAEHA